MADEPIAEILAAGRLGRFWEWRDGTAESSVPPMYGHLLQQGDHVEVTVAVPDDEETAGRLDDALAGRQSSVPEALLGVLEHETVLLTGLSRIGPGLRWKRQPLTNTATYLARHAVAHIYGHDRLNSPKLRSASVVFPGMLRWAGIDSIKSTNEVDEAGLITTGRVDLLPLPDSPYGRVRPGLSLRADAQWSVNESSAEQLAVSTGLVIDVKSRQPVPIEDLVRTFSHVQLAIVLAHRKWMVPQPGWATLDLSGGQVLQGKTHFWSGTLMTEPHRLLGKREPLVSPYFNLEQFGGARGLARWVRICDELPRVVEPLKMFYRNGATTVYDHIDATCSAIEYWAASWKARPGWGPVAGAPSGGLGKLHVVAHRLGRPWNQFVGDLDKWAEFVWDAYLSTKHFRPTGRDLPSNDLHILTTSVDLLLTAALANEAAGNRKPLRALLAHHHLLGFGQQLRTLLA